MSFWIHTGYFVLFGIIVSLVVSAFREDDPRAIFRGAGRRLLKFTAFAAVLGLGILALEKIVIGNAYGACAMGLTVHSGNKSFSLDKAPADFPSEFKEVILQYRDYAVEQGLIVVCAPPHPIVFFTAGAPAEAGKLLKQSEKLLGGFESKLGKRRHAGLLPVFLLKKTVQYAPLVQVLVARHSYLASWAEQAKDLSGFFLVKPPIAVILQDGVKQEEFQLENQVLHQLVHLELGMQFGPTPFWLAEGIAWVFEEEMTGTLYSFCYRDGFVFASEHTGWMDDTRKLAQKKQFPSFEQIVGSGKSGFNKVRSLGSYGLVRYLLSAKSESLQESLDAYAKEHREKFSQDPTQEIPLARQKEIFEGRFGADFNAAAQKYLLALKSK